MKVGVAIVFVGLKGKVSEQTAEVGQRETEERNKKLKRLPGIHAKYR